MIRPRHGGEHSGLEQLGDVRRAVGGLPTTADRNVIVHGPIHRHLPGAYPTGGGTVVGVAVTGIEAECFDSRQVLQDRGEHLQVPFLDVDAALRAAHVEQADSQRADVRSGEARVGRIQGAIAAVVGADSVAELAGRYVRQRALDVQLDLILLQRRLSADRGVDDVYTVLRRGRGRERVQAARAMGQQTGSAVIEIRARTVVRQVDQGLIAVIVHESGICRLDAGLAVRGKDVECPVLDPEVAAQARQHFVRVGLGVERLRPHVA